MNLGFSFVLGRKKRSITEDDFEAVDKMIRGHIESLTKFSDQLKTTSRIKGPQEALTAFKESLEAVERRVEDFEVIRRGEH